MPKVSIIIPFNNVEVYIRECLTSVVCQTLKDIEIICVNDASTDGSKSIVEEFASKDERIKIIDLQERQGQGYARNRAIEAATGDYIGFVDSDDKVEVDMFEVLYNNALKNDNDITICQAREYDDINDKYILSDYYSLTLLNKMGDSVFAAEDVKDELLDINVVLWNKIYKRTYLEKIGEKFPEGFIYEDLPFFFGTFLPAKRIQIVWKNFYIYRVNRKNSTMQQFNKKILDRLPMVSLTYEKMKKCGYLNDIQDRIKGWIINDLFHRYTLLKENFQREYFFEMKKIFQSLDIEDIENPYWKSVYHFQGYLLVLNNTFEDFNQKIFNEYLDIHEIENRLRTEMCSSQSVDAKISLLYSDLNKTYDYTNKLSQECNARISGETEKIYKDISLVYEEISKNYNYTDTLSDKLNEQTDAKLQEVKENISSVNNSVNIIQNDYLSKFQFEDTFNSEVKNIYEEIAFNYDKTNEIFNNEINNLKADVDITSSQIKKEFGELKSELTSGIDYLNAQTDEKISHIKSDINDKIAGVYEKIAQDYNNLTYLIENNSDSIIKTTDKKIEEKICIIYDDINKIKNVIKSDIIDSENSISQRINDANNRIVLDFNSKIDDIHKLTEKKLDYQKKLYEEQIQKLNERINYLSKSPIKRFLEKIMKKKKK